MKRLFLFLALAGCVKHPAITVGVTAGTIGLLTCEMNGADQSVCGIITASAGLFLGGLAAVVTYFADTSAHELPPDEEIKNGRIRLHTHTEPPPVLLDAGVPADAPADAGVVDASAD